ncbi:MAG: response regulator [Phycisphaerae bacterium]|nr:response regulator [Phycisphaerae bacterium]
MSGEIDLQSITVLGVDDTPDNLDLLEDYLEGEVWNFLRARSGEECIRLALDPGADIILLDLNMPNMNGLSVVRSLRAIQRLQQIPVILQTAYASKENVLAASRLGCTHILAKPLSRDRLLSEMRACLAERPRPAADETSDGDRSDPRVIAHTARQTRQLVQNTRLADNADGVATVDAIQDLISGETALGERLIRVANSPTYAGRHRVRTVVQAVVRLGIVETRRLIRKASDRMLQGVDSDRTLKSLDLLESITRLFPERAATEEGLLGLLEELGRAPTSAAAQGPAAASPDAG